MARPVILVSVSAADTRADVAGQLERRYSADYRIVALGGAEEGAAELDRLAAAGEQVALLLADDGRGGDASLFAHVRRLFPDSRRGRVIEWGAWADSAVTRSVLDAMGDGLIEYYVLRPGPVPDESFHRSVIEFLIDWARATGGRQDVAVVGDDASPRTHELRALLARNGISHRWLPPGSDEARTLLGGTGDAGGPSVVLRDGRVLADPTNTDVLAAYGLTTGLPQEQPVDLAIVGAGPGGLAAAVYAASEGLRTVVLERDAIGGQAGSSSLIRNYLGFSRGVSGSELAQRAFQQAWLFGAHFAHTREVIGMTLDEHFRLSVAPGEELVARAVVLATGVSYRRLELGDLSAFVGASVFYGASAVEARAQTGKVVHVVGGGNSAGQAALHLARYARDVSIIVRGEHLAESMSAYLIAELEAAGVHVLTQRRLVGGGSSSGSGRLDHIVLRSRATGEEEVLPSEAVFITIGAAPHTSWLDPAVKRDKWGFVLTGTDVIEAGGWPLARNPGTFESSLPGFFAIGDVRRGSVKRVANSVGEGSAVVSTVHAFLAEESATEGHIAP